MVVLLFWCLPEILLGYLVMLVFLYWKAVSQRVDNLNRQWFLRWLRRGVVVPVIMWILMNAGRTPFMPPLTQWIAAARAAGSTYSALWWQIGLAAMPIASCWAALSFGWFMTGLIKRAKNGEDLILAAVFWSPVLPLALWGFAELCGWAALGFAAVLWLWPLTQYCLNLADFRETAPAYSHAIGKIKFGKYTEAEMAIIGELEKCETDFDGWMLMAELYAHHFHDLVEAEKTIHELCADPNTTLPQISIALHRLADWHLNLCENPTAARRVLEEICARMPGTHLEVMARNRINQLPKSSEELHEQRNPRPVPLHAMSNELGETEESTQPARSSQEATAAAQQLVEKLKEDPNDATSRERLARILAGELGHINMGVEQLELLLGMPGQPAAKCAEWLGQMGAWQLKQNDAASARDILERLIRDYPQTPQGFAAQRRLALLKAEARIRKKGGAKPVPEGLG